MRGYCYRKKCVWRTQVDKHTYYCPFKECPLNEQGEIDNDRKRVEQPISHRTTNKKA